MTKLTLHSVTAVNELVNPSSGSAYSLNSPAVEFFTDFHHVQPKVISSAITAQDALNTMIKTHVRMMLVLDEKRQFVGMVTARDVAEQNIVAYAASQNEKVTEVAVTDLMQRKKDLLALSITDIEAASIGDVIEFLQENPQQHCLVLDAASEQLRGVFSSSDISRKLQLSINIQEQSSFSKVYAVTRS